MVGQCSDHPCGHEAAKGRQGIGHAEDGAAKVWRNIQTVAQVARSDSSMCKQSQRKKNHCPSLIHAQEHQCHHQQTRRNKSCKSKPEMRLMLRGKL